MRDRLGYEAIKQLHKQIDDDENGSLDRSESDGVSLRSLHDVFHKVDKL